MPGTPSLRLESFADFALCRTEARTGLHEVWFIYDDEWEYIARAYGDDEEIRRFSANVLYAQPIITSLLIDDDAAEDALSRFDAFLRKDRAVVFTLGYRLGLGINNIPSRHTDREPLIYAAGFDSIAVHDYNTTQTYLTGNKTAGELFCDAVPNPPASTASAYGLSCDIAPAGYVGSILSIQDRIREGDTYQTNLTRKITAELPAGLSPSQIFSRVRKQHPAPFAAFIQRPDSAVVSASPERFFHIAGGLISTSPIKGTRPRGQTPAEDASLRKELARSSKDRAENTMIVDLLRNDLGRVCEFGSVRVERLCEIEEHPSLFHLVSTVNGRLRLGTKTSDVLRSLFPCGSITGAPKIGTMRIIDSLERSPRGLSMGAIGVYVPASFGIGEFLDTSVAIRTMTVRGRTAEFNVGGGIVIDSDPRSEYEETVTKSLALLSALGF